MISASSRIFSQSLPTLDEVCGTSSESPRSVDLYCLLSGGENIRPNPVVVTSSPLYVLYIGYRGTSSEFALSLHYVCDTSSEPARFLREARNTFCESRCSLDDICVFIKLCCSADDPHPHPDASPAQHIVNLGNSLPNCKIGRYPKKGGGC